MNYVDDARQVCTEVYRMYVSGAWASIPGVTATGEDAGWPAFTTWRAYCDNGLKVRQVFTVRNPEVQSLRDALIRDLWNADCPVKDICAAVGMGRSALAERARRLGLSRYDVSGRDLGKSDADVPADEAAMYTVGALREMPADQLAVLLGADKIRELAALVRA